MDVILICFFKTTSEIVGCFSQSISLYVLTFFFFTSICLFVFFLNKNKKFLSSYRRIMLLIRRFVFGCVLIYEILPNFGCGLICEIFPIAVMGWLKFCSKFFFAICWVPIVFWFLEKNRCRLHQLFYRIWQYLYFHFFNYFNLFLSDYTLPIIWTYLSLVDVSKLNTWVLLHFMFMFIFFLSTHFYFCNIITTEFWFSGVDQVGNVQ